MLLPLLLLACALPDAAVPCSRAPQIDLVRLAVRDYDAWRRVWDQKIRTTGSLRPPYYRDDGDGGRPALSAYARDALRLPADDGGHVAPFAVARLVLDRYAWLGSYVEYAVRVFRAAVSCLTAQYAWLQAELLALSATKMTAPALEPTGTARLTGTFAAVRDALLAYADKLAAVHGDMKPAADASFRLARLIAEKPVDCARALSLLRDEMARSVDDRCARATAAELYGHFGDADGYARMLGDQTTWADVADAVGTVARRSADMFNRLGPETIPAANWNQLLDYQYPIDIGVNVDAADPVTAGGVSP